MIEEGFSGQAFTLIIEGGICPMKWFTRLLITTLVSAGLLVGLSFLPQLERLGSSTVFRSVKAQPISDTNIVDVMSKTQLHLRIRRVEVSHAIVSVDLLASPSTGKKEIVQDLYELPRSLFHNSTNINQVLVRVMDSSKESGRTTSLLVATDARREKWMPNETGLSQQSAEELEEYLQTHFRMTYTPKWQDRFEIKS
jgi:hypothetical protein